jgi:glutamate dehydrogenase/leucine dehydrogenase
MTATPTSPEDLTVQVGRRSGLSIVIAVDSTLLGPALGGCRLRRYPSLGCGRRDALSLASAMTIKAAVAGLAHGGGKTVVVLPDGAPPLDPLLRRNLLLDVGDAVEAHGGRYLVGPDVGTGPNDMDVIAARTTHVLCRTERAHGSGDSAPATAAGAYNCIRAVHEHLTGSADVAGARVGILGLGSVGRLMAQALAEDGAQLVATDIDPSCRAVAQQLGAQWIEPDVLPTLDLDVLVPAAMGGLIDDERAGKLRCRAVVGPANNQLSGEHLADVLHRRGVLWAPDYVVGAGGIVNAVARELDDASAEETRGRVLNIAATLRSVLDAAAQHDRTPHEVAMDRAHERLRAAATASADGSRPARRGQG